MAKLIIMGILGVVLWGCGATAINTSTAIKEIEKERDCAKGILAADSILGGMRNLETLESSLSFSIDKYTTALKSLDYSACSTDFRRAFMEHIKAWENLKNVTNKYPSFRGEMHEVFKRLERGEEAAQFAELLKDIWATWDRVVASSQ